MVVRAVDVLSDEIVKMGIGEIFGIPGGQIMPLFDAFYGKGIKIFLFRHEQGAIHAADAYGRVTRKPGVVLVTSGPGATNLATGLANAMMDSSPLVALTGQVPTSVFGRDAFQETDIIGLSIPIAKHTFMVKKPEDLVPMFKAAYRIATDGRPGPVVVDLPRDVQLSEVKEVRGEDYVKVSYKGIPEPDPGLVAYAVKLLMEAERPVMLVGGGVCWSNATEEVLAVAETLWMPIVTTLPGKNCVPNNHPLFMGPAGMHGRVEADAAIMNSDLVLAVGTRFSDRTVGDFREFQRGRRIIHIDIDKSEIGKNVKPSVGIIGDAKATLRMMLELLPKAAVKNEQFVNWLRSIKEAYEKFRETSDMPGFAPWRVLKVIREVTPPQAIVATGVGSHQMWSELHWDVYVPGTFITSAGLGTMGFGIPAALGAKVARPNVPVLDIDGDGSFQMTMQNLALVREYNLPIIVVIFDNSALMLVRHWQMLLYGRRIIAVDFQANPDFIKIGEAYGIDGVRPSNYDELRSSVARAIRNNEPLIVDVTIDRERDLVLPWVQPGKWLSEVVLPEGFKVNLRYGDA
ncbi:biosynthetic-type acetolactate synthase large subunit [Caldivirga sp. MU80]|uniref:biosynthetic-type acetolactate synthase large subunit n=1 Tax=Caldivirga sp. MU80 TaxID=1650354 RepID=UPI00082956A8|nr:biosynthetic-type acetolactate synthase large subunit [Caldivirga sp. MU80]